MAAVDEMHAPVARLQHAPGGVQTPAAVQGVLAVQRPLHADWMVCEQPPVAELQHAPRWAQGSGLQVIGLAYQMPGVGQAVCATAAHAPVSGLQQTPGVVVLGQGVGLQVPPK